VTRNDVRPVPGRFSELLIVKLNCIFALFQHLSVACMNVPPDERPLDAGVMPWLHNESPQAAVIKVFTGFGHPHCAKLMFKHNLKASKSTGGAPKQRVGRAARPGKASKPSNKKPKTTSKRSSGRKAAPGSEAILSKKAPGPEGKAQKPSPQKLLLDDIGESDDNSGAEDESTLAKAVKACLEPCLKNLVFKADLQGVATKDDVEKAMLKVRSEAVLDAAGNVSLAITDLVDTAEQKTAEVAAGAISKMDSKQPAQPSRKRKKGAVEKQEGMKDDQEEEDDNDERFIGGSTKN